MNERTTLEIIAPTVEEALAQGLAQLGLPASAVSVEVLDSGNKGLFGLGGRQVRVRLSVNPPGGPPAPVAASEARPAAPAMGRRDRGPRDRGRPAEQGHRGTSRPEDRQPHSRPQEHRASDDKPAPVPTGAGMRETVTQAPRGPRRPFGRPRREEKPGKPGGFRGQAAPRSSETEALAQITRAIEEAEPSSNAALPPAAETHEGHDALLDTAEATISKLLFHMGLQAQVSAHYGEAREDRRPIMVDVRGTDLGILIGRRGETLASFQYLSALMVGKASGEFVRLLVDVEGHRDRRERQLRQLAHRMAEQVLKTGRKLTLEPMPASERRIIHLELRDHPAVTTESVGEEPHRKVTIIPKES